jgi:hypothetical protein
MVACDRGGVLHRGRQDIEDRRAEFPDKWLACQESNGDGITGGIREALIGADVCIAFAHPGPGVIQPEWLTGMRSDAIVFARANPVPEIWPEDAKAAGARIVATGRSHLPNQLDNFTPIPRHLPWCPRHRRRPRAGPLRRHAPARRRGHLAHDDRVGGLPPGRGRDRPGRPDARHHASADGRRRALPARVPSDPQRSRATHTLMREGLVPPVPRAFE